MFRGLFHFWISALFLLFATSSEAVVLQILHTNDLHAAMKTAGVNKRGDQEFGGWARVRARLDELTSEARSKGIETLKLDAGDYLEGSTYYFPDNGIHVLRAFQGMGYDAVAIGNHDWLMGARDMDALYGQSPFSFPVLAANVKVRKHLHHLSQQVQPSTQIQKAGIKIGVFGLSTDEALYSWIPQVKSHRKDLQILAYKDRTHFDPLDHSKITREGIANRVIRRLRQENDLVIALTHIGYGEDRLLASNSDGLDLVIGGHSHSVLESLDVVADRTGHEVPVVQAGFNGKYIGRIFVEVEPGQRPKVLSYELIAVPLDGERDPIQDAYLNEAQAALERLYGPGLDQVIGRSNVRLISGNRGPTAYSKFVVDAIRDQTGSDLSLDVGAFHGNTPQPAGEVTRKTLMELYPRKFEQEQNEGLYVYTGELPGVAIKIGLEYTMRFGIYLSFSGLDYEVGKLTDEEFSRLKARYRGTSKEKLVTPYFPMNIRINHTPIDRWHWYSASVPEALVRGAFGITRFAGLIFRHSSRSEHTLWNTFSDYLSKIKVIEPLPVGLHFDAGEFNPEYQGMLKDQEVQDQYALGEMRSVPWVRDDHVSAEWIRELFHEILKELR
jgi:2',3'-cyclic-nucleotide 2'-phosphodiesterase (5'-nucleotidase family)